MSRRALRFRTTRTSCPRCPTRRRRTTRATSPSRRFAAPALAALALIAAGCGNGEDGSAATAPAAQEQGEAIPERLVERLREGGYVLAIRHAATDSGMDTTDDLGDCSKQRNLDARGRRQSREIGAALRDLGIPVGRVLASPFCRTRDTARLAFGRRARSSRALLSPEFLGDDETGLERLLAAEPPRGTNTVLVSHGSGIDAAAGVNPAEGEAVIVDPGGGKGGFEVVETVKADEWR